MHFITISFPPCHRLYSKKCNKQYRTWYPMVYNQQHLANLDFADDIILIGKTFRELEDLTYGIYDEGSKVGLKVSDEKTKSMEIMETSNNRISIQNKQIEEVDAFAYLGSIVSTEGRTEEDIKRKLGKPWGFFENFKRSGQ